MFAMMAAFVLSLAALWNSLLTAGVKHEGWVIVFMMVEFVSGTWLFYIAYKTTDFGHLEREREQAFESGKAEILKELEKQNQEVKNENKSKEEDVENMVHLVLAGIKTKLDQKSCNRLLANLGKTMGFVQGIFYIRDPNKSFFKVEGEFALTGQKPAPFRKGEGLAGQAAESKSPVVLYDIPEQYFDIASALGSAKPRFLLLVPVIYENECNGVIELAAFTKPGNTEISILQRLSVELGVRIYTSLAA